MDKFINNTGKEDKNIEISRDSSYTIADIARELGVSKTTVSRAISGKGRISEKTRDRVLNLIEENNYRPNPMAKGLANQRTYNICWAMPGDSTITELPFFQRCLLGIVERAASNDYDILISMTYEENTIQLSRILDNRKVDGVILGRTLTRDRNIALLKEKGIPFVVIGTSDEEDVVQVDNDHVKACRELTDILILKGIRRIALIGGNMNHTVNRSRYEGFEEALHSRNINPDPNLVYLNNEKNEEIERAVDNALMHNTECIMCMDDRICATTVHKLKGDGVIIPEEVKVASFYNSSLLNDVKTPITTLQYDPKELGNSACETLLKLINGEETELKRMLGYEVLLKGSTQ
ncbi:MAG: LacI family transcriptional regulator [Lachnospiraceae bacterium]|nr:LacI family transcriptional regulator [Lachnospiraceae bacterium]